MVRACIFAHYDKNSEVQEYVYYYLNELLTIVKDLVFVTVSNIDEIHIMQLNNLGIQVIKRENKGYDFYSYKTGLKHLNINIYDELILCNDSVFGPLNSMKNIFTRMEDKQCDFWGITSSTLQSYHIQSYFLVFKKNILISPSFSKFWNNVEILTDKEEIIKLYEVGLSQHLLKDGFIPDVYLPYEMTLGRKIFTGLKNLLQQPSRTINLIRDPLSSYKNVISKKCNPTIDVWEDLLKKHDNPFIKKALFSSEKEARENLAKLNISESLYDINLIIKYVKKSGNSKI